MSSLYTLSSQPVAYSAHDESSSLFRIPIDRQYLARQHLSRRHRRWCPRGHLRWGSGEADENDECWEGQEDVQGEEWLHEITVGHNIQKQCFFSQSYKILLRHLSTTRNLAWRRLKDSSKPARLQTSPSRTPLTLSRGACWKWSTVTWVRS